MEDTAMSKIHFLFLMLNITQLTVVDQGVIVGIIAKSEFVKKRKEEGPIKKK
jgi:predicted transcriptional regulator